MRKAILIALNISLDIGGYFLFSALAMMERGYNGVGGEWLLILGLPILWGYLTWEYMIRRERKNGRIRRNRAFCNR